MSNLSTVNFFKHLNSSQENGICLEGEILRKYQTYLLKIAEDIISVCEENNVHYHLTGGSALGAVRHHGFIPWDDDMDIDILGDDFDLFVVKFREKYGNRYWIHTCRTHDYGLTINRIRLKGSVFRGREDIDNKECGFFVDIMRMENVSDVWLFRNLHGFLCMISGFLLSCRNFYKNRSFLQQYADSNQDFRKAYRIKVFLGRLTAVMSLDAWTRLTQKIYGLCHNSHSKYVSVPSGRKHFFGELRERNGFVTARKELFEGRLWNIPADIEGYLTSMYGDYMTLPAEEERENHIVLELRFPED